MSSKRGLDSNHLIYIVIKVMERNDNSFVSSVWEKVLFNLFRSSGLMHYTKIMGSYEKRDKMKL